MVLEFELGASHLLGRGLQPEPLLQAVLVLGIWLTAKCDPPDLCLPSS
jgi:hypothetical protein